MNRVTHFSASRLKKLIIDNELALVLKELVDFTDGRFGAVYNMIVILFSNFKEIRKESILTTNTYEQQRQAENRLKNSLLELIDQLDEIVAIENVLLPNKKMITFTIEGNFDERSPQMSDDFLASLSTKYNKDMNNFTIKYVYRGSINIVIEADEASITSLMADFEATNATNPVELPNGMTIRNVTTDNEAAIHKKIALCFYNLLLLESPNFEAAKGIYEAMGKQGMTPNIDIFTHLIRVTPDYQTALIWFNYMRDKGIASNEAWDNLMKKKNHTATYTDIVQSLTVDDTEQKAVETSVVGLMQDALMHALSEQPADVAQYHKELSIQLATHIFENLDKQAAHEWPSYIWYSVNQWAVNQDKNKPIQQETRLNLSKITISEPNSDFVLSDVFIKDDYLMFNAFELTIVRRALGDADYLLLEAHFREGKNYKTIAKEMDFDVPDVARRINLARKICQKLKNGSQN